MGWSQTTRLFTAAVVGVLGTSVFYLALLLVQIENADQACESPEATVPRVRIEDIRDIRFENSFLNLSGRRIYRMDDGSVVVTREPGWFPATIVGFLVMLAGPVATFARRKGRSGALFGITTMVAPPLGLALSLAVTQRARSGAAP